MNRFLQYVSLLGLIEDLKRLYRWQLHAMFIFMSIPLLSWMINVHIPPSSLIIFDLVL